MTTPEHLDVDVLVVGSGAGGSAMAYALRDSGARVLVAEQGGRLPEPSSADTITTLADLRRSAAGKDRVDRRGRHIASRNHHCVGGNTKFFAAHFPRLRRADFGDVSHRDGIAPRWPFAYEDLEPYYVRAEQLFHVHGQQGADPTDPPRSAPYPYEAVEHHPAVGELARRLRSSGLQPYPLPLGIDAPGACRRCANCDGFPCAYGAKFDADSAALRPALTSATVQLSTDTRVLRLDTSADGRRVVSALASRRGRELRIHAGTYVVSAGAIESAALLLRSVSRAHPHGLANRSGRVGQNFMRHNLSHVVAVDPSQPVATFQKTLGINDFYLAGAHTPAPLGNAQLVGKLTRTSFPPASAAGSPAWQPEWTEHSVDWLCISEDLPARANHVRPVTETQTLLEVTPNNLRAHQDLVNTLVLRLRDIGFSEVHTRTAGPEATSHQCGTVVAGDDPATSVLDPWCRSHDVDNLFVVDGSFFPSSGAINPTLTIVAQALRVGAGGDVLP